MNAKKLPSGSWQCRVVDHYEYELQPDGTKKRKIKWKNFICKDTSRSGKRKCEQMASEWLSNREEQNNGTKTFGDALDDYIGSREAVLSVRTIDEYKRIRSKHLQSIMSIPIDDITQEDIQKCINIEAMTHSPKTVRNWHGLISAVMTVYRPSVTLRTVLPQKVRAEYHIPTEEEINALLEHIKGTELELPVLLAIFAPMRRGEICALTRDDTSGSVIHVNKSMVSHDGEWIIKAPKSYSGDRYIDMPEHIVKLWEKIPEGRLTRYNPGTLYKAFYNALKDAGIKHFRFHDLRHYGASMLHSLMIPDQYIMERGGWKTDTTLKNVYRHTISEKQKETTDKINSYFKSISE